MNEAATAVKIINDKLFDQDIEHDYFSYLEYVQTPIGDYIKFQGKCLWDSENDYREWINDDEQEPLEDYLIGEIKKFVEVNKTILKTLKQNKEK